MEKVKVGIVGSRFAAQLHAESYKRCPAAIVHSVSAIDNLDEFGESYGIANRYGDYHDMFEKEDLDLASVCVPNYLHREVVIAAASAGIGAIICEKPLATSIEDGLEMVRTCREGQVKLMYAEDWIFAPALVRAKQICQEGGIGDILYVKAKETHNGSHSAFAQKKEYCGGGSMIHVGIHPVGFLPWLVEAKIAQVMGMVTGGSELNLLHKDYTGEDWAAALVLLDDGTRGFVEGNYIACGGMDDKIEIYGAEGNIHIDLTQGSPLKVYSRSGYGYAIEKADFTHGWTSPAVDEFMSLGYVNEIAHFVDCVRNDTEPQRGTTGEDGLHALAVTLAIYESAENDCLIQIHDDLGRT
ncbi:MAG: Gfo/Idh/MocA family oxidoreductase [Fidelibacterota bacterium]|nr:MAG: Gfo/Idh/MocA family oxidoreductase [Candidatus Neomarinimicrobiota bacterium]